jgi:hypothetical protein
MRQKLGMNPDPYSGIFTLAILAFTHELCYLIPGGAHIQRAIERRLRNMK